MEATEDNVNDDNIRKIKQNYNKEIITNMKEVINSTKKKRKYQQRRRKENLKKMEPEISDISMIMNNTLNLISPNVSMEEIQDDNKIPLKENSLTQTQSNKSLEQQSKKRNIRSKRDSITTNYKSPIKMMTIKDHFSSKSTVHVMNTNQSENKKLNAFEVMMNARNKSIGSNSPGRDPDKNEVDSLDTSNEKANKVKRKLILEEWAEKKGARKRKLENDARGEFIENEMNKRAKRLKKLLENGTPESSKAQSKLSSNGQTIKRVRKSKKEKQEETFQMFSDSESDDFLHLKDDSKEKNEKKRKKRKYKRRETAKCLSPPLDSVKLVADDEENVKKKETDEFLSKLSSPFKKRDSLLGYFPKIISPILTSTESSKENTIKDKSTKNKSKKKQDDNDDDDKNSSKLKNRRKQNLKELSSSVSSLDVSKDERATEITDSGRPKRSCVGKARYDKDYYYLDSSSIKSKERNDTKREPRKSTRRKTRTIDMKAIDIICNDNNAATSPEIIDLESSIEGTSIKDQKSRSKSLKLAPVFIKSMPKPSLDPELLKARQKFLQSGIPEKMRLEIIKQKQFEQAYEESIEYFPKISHVLQLSENDVVNYNKEINWKKCKIIWRSEEESSLVTLKNSVDKKCKLIDDLSRRDMRVFPLQKLPEIPNKRLFVKELKVKYDKFPTYRCYNQLREKYKTFSAKDADLDTCQVSESFVVTRALKRSSTMKKQSTSEYTSSQDDELVKPPSSAPNGELLFTEKYKPMTSEQVLVNLSPINALREFLSAWQVGRNTKLNDSMIDFELTNDSSKDTVNISNSVVLLGPSSSGKTNAVFALANELNFNVLEINAGMKRKGKKLLQELLEATQSHQVSRDSVKKNLLKQSRNGFKKKITDMHDSSSSLDQNNTEKMSLILVEDADIVFEQDAGFVEAIYQLSTLSKRPVIITANNPNCQHLLKLINYQVIHFFTLNTSNISKFLSILSLIENCPIDLDDIMKLYQYNNHNARKTLLEMQFFIQSGGDRTNKSLLFQKGYADIDCDKVFTPYIHKTLFNFYTNNQNSYYCIPFPLNYDILRENFWDIFKASSNIQSNIKVIGKKSLLKKNLNKINEKQKEINVLNILTNLYENISTGVYVSKGNGVDCADLCSPNLSEEISHYLVEQSMKVILETDSVPYNHSIEQDERISLTSYTPTNWYRSKRSLTLEYEPCLRSICRSEKSRSQEERRGTRFYHYLRNTCTNLYSFSTDLFDSSCSILMDPVPLSSETLQ